MSTDAAGGRRDDLWPGGSGSLAGVQEELGRRNPEPWRPGPAPLAAAGCFVAFRRGEAGPGHAGDRAWAAAALVIEGGRVLRTAVVPGVAGDAYAPGFLARREGAMLLDALASLIDGPAAGSLPADAVARRPDVLLVDATGRDHPRRAGLALHLGAVLDLPSVGVTHRTLLASGEPPLADREGASAPVWLDGEMVGAWVRTRRGVRPVVAHAAWRTDPATAIEVVLRMTGAARTPEPLRVARMMAREARADAEGRLGRRPKTDR